MLRQVFCLMLLALGACRVAAQPSLSAQHPDDEYYPYGAEWEEPQTLLLTDSMLFYRALHAPSDLYGAHTGFTLPDVSVSRRGQSWNSASTVFAGALLPSYRAAVIRQMGATESYYAGPAAALGATADGSGVHLVPSGTRYFRFANDPLRAAYSVSAGFTDRNYLAAVKLSAAQPFGRGWSGALAVDARTGRDMYVDGVFTNALTVGLRLCKEFSAEHSLDLTLVAGPSMRGTRLSSVEEAFTLTNDRLYNPAWGFQAGKVRNSRIRRDFVPLAVASYRVPIARTTTLTAGVAAEFGVQKYSSLDWYNARTPMPDNYRYLPDYTGDAATEKAWRDRDARYTQIAWDDLIAQNRMSSRGAVYTLADRVERVLNLQADVLFTTRLERRLTLEYGFFYRRRSSRNYKQMRDLLGGDRVTDIDQYLIDDDTYGNLLQNDLRHPDRLIGAGDRFGYDYSLVTRDAGVRLRAAYRSDRLRADAALSLGSAAVYRQGHYEKELFPGSESYGPSRKMKFTPYTAGALVGWAFSPRSYVELAASAGATLADADALFVQSYYNNRTIDNPSLEHFYAAELNYRRRGATLTLELSAFAVMTTGGADTRRYFDDLSGLYCNVTATGIGRLCYGLEASAGIRLSPRWNLALAASAGRYEYIRDPLVTVLSDADNTMVDDGSRSHLGGCYAGNAPQVTASAEISWFGRKGWGLRASAGYAGFRYVEPVIVRRTERVARQGGTTPESFERFMTQERLPDAVTLDASVFKTFYFTASQLNISLSVRNLLGDNDMVYNGYESMRVRRVGSGASTGYEPHATRYLYAGGRSLRLTVAYKF